MNQFYSIVHEEKFYKVRYPTSEGRAKKYTTPKLKNQQVNKTKHLNDNLQKIAYQFPVKNFQLISQASKSETFIHPHSRLSMSRLEKDRVGIRKINSKITEWKNARFDPNQQRLEAEFSEHCEKSLQRLLAPKPNNYKTQYSKITRRKETIIKRNLVIEDNQKIEVKNVRSDTNSEQKIIEKYRQLVQQNKPLNLINRLFQHDILLTKLMPLSTKQRLIINNIAKNQKQIEDRINKIVSRPSQYDTIRKMLLNIHDKAQENSEYPYQTKEILTKNESQLIQLHDNTTKLASINIKKREKEQQFKRTLVMQFSKSKQKGAHKNQHGIFPKKIESDSHLNPLAEKEVITPPKNLTCTAFIIYQVPNIKKQPLKKSAVELPKKREYLSNIHAGSNIKISSEIASLTKIMTCVIVIEVCQRLGINPQTEKYRTGIFESFIRGTSAQIEPGQIYSIHELLHGLMLPSGNDASLALARWAGNVLLLNDQENNKRIVMKQQYSSKSQAYFWALQNKYLRCEEERLRPKRCYNRFIAEMNKRARLLGMERTGYVNSHGLSNNLNRSCCLDLALLCQHAMQNDYFRQIVACKQFLTTIDKEITLANSGKGKKSPKNICADPEEMNLQADAEDRETDDQSQYEQEQCKEQSKEERAKLQKKQVRWMNTHKLLHERQEYIGIKTGVTVTAGPCLASWLRIKERDFIIIVLNSKKLSYRFTDTEILRQWVQRKEKLKCTVAIRQEQQNAQSSDEDS